jgi:hypothetical protein
MTPICVITAHAGADSLEECLPSWGSDIPTYVIGGTTGMLAAYERAWHEHEAAIYCYLHDDVRIDDPVWWVRVLQEFEAPDVGVVGFGGALVHGSPDLYRTPYRLQQVGRSGYLSNVEDAEVHGARFTGARDVAVLDGFALCVRRELLERAGGWPVEHLDYVGYDYFLSAVAHRLGYRCRVLGVKCHHYGGRTAVALKFRENDNGEHERAHRYIYQQFVDVLPWRCA